MGLYKGKMGFVHYSFISNGAWAYKKVWNLSFGLGFDDGGTLRLIFHLKVLPCPALWNRFTQGSITRRAYRET